MWIIRVIKAWINVMSALRLGPKKALTALRGRGSEQGTQGGRRASCHAHPSRSIPPRGAMHKVHVRNNMAPITMRRWRGWKSCVRVPDVCIFGGMM